MVVQGQWLFCHRAERCHKDETNTSRGHLISISCSSQISKKNSHIRDDALRDMQGCSKSSYIFFSILTPLVWECNKPNQFWWVQMSLYSVSKLLILSLTHSNQPELKTSHGNCLGFLRDRNAVLRNGFETKIENVFDKIQLISYLTCWISIIFNTWKENSFHSRTAWSLECIEITKCCVLSIHMLCQALTQLSSVAAYL